MEHSLTHVVCMTRIGFGEEAGGQRSRRSVAPESWWEVGRVAPTSWWGRGALSSGQKTFWPRAPSGSRPGRQPCRPAALPPTDLVNSFPAAGNYLRACWRGGLLLLWWWDRGNWTPGLHGLGGAWAGRGRPDCPPPHGAGREPAQASLAVEWEKGRGLYEVTQCCAGRRLRRRCYGPSVWPKFLRVGGEKNLIKQIWRVAR